ncbi:hypothetical protein ONE63_005328 [Megalurothrips usitatus]|uniref:non-specific serine/threonine protein kinase n=1 Tax=Megalurothrips usitatus TaxID=439358 RepID=A0AAV7Y1Y1_9NEOP|nr:hypothetical protein ONE63_005328 [Megalurothrips usitatus]
MEKYNVIPQPIGQGSYGTVYKAVVKHTNEVVALKIITKRQKTVKEIQNIRQEFEIQRTLCHPNIIRMLDSFETEDDIMVVTEFAPQDLSQILQQEGHLHEDEVKNIVCDLLSALYYLHYHRVLHRDLKPQNILVEANRTVKLCDFGFARSMSIDTYVLTSIKGTPLYMAPEIIKHCPYDHSADLWSLGCIVYECLVGSPPYYTNALIRLVNLIQNEIDWPNFVSAECLSFLQGLLQRDPSKRLSWPELLSHPFIDRSKINLANIPSNAAVVVPLTHPLTASQALAREKQKKDLICHVAGKPRNYTESAKYLEQQEYKQMVLQELQSRPKTKNCLPNLDQQGLVEECLTPSRKNVADTIEGNQQSEKYNNADPAEQTNHNFTVTENSKTSKFITCAGVQTCDISDEKNGTFTNATDNAAINKKSGIDFNQVTKDLKAMKIGGQSLLTCISEDNTQPIECEEWLVFLQKTMEEVMEGEVDVMTQENFVAMLVAPMRNPLASSKVIEYVANLLSLPFVVNGVTDHALVRIKEVYLVVKVVPNLVYTSNLLTQQRSYDNSHDAGDIQSLPPAPDLKAMKADELHAMECIYLLLCNLTHMCDDFLMQFCDVVAVFDGIALLQQLLHLGSRKPRIVADLLAILAHILRTLPENATLVEQIILGSAQGGKDVDLRRILKSKCPLLRARCCHLLRQLGLWSCRALQNAWTTQLRTDLEDLCGDSNDSVRQVSMSLLRHSFIMLIFLSYHSKK